MAFTLAPVIALLFAGKSLAQSCPGGFPESDPAITAKGFTAQVIAKNLTNPRGIIFDNDGNLLVLEKFRGVAALKLRENGNCVTVESNTRVVSDGTVSNIKTQEY
jgi:glucose/arabinose dehydrogenase